MLSSVTTEWTPADTVPPTLASQHRRARAYVGLGVPDGLVLQSHRIGARQVEYGVRSPGCPSSRCPIHQLGRERLRQCPHRNPVGQPALRRHPSDQSCATGRSSQQMITRARTRARRVATQLPQSKAIGLGLAESRDSNSRPLSGRSLRDAAG